MRLVRRTLRGRYRLAALLAGLLAAVGGTVGYFAVPAKYMSTGLVQIEGVIPAILYPILMVAWYFTTLSACVMLARR